MGGVARTKKTAPRRGRLVIEIESCYVPSIVKGLCVVFLFCLLNGFGCSFILTELTGVVLIR